MEVETSVETIERKVYNTDKFTFKISPEKLEKLEESKNKTEKIAEAIQKGMRQKVSKATGSEWEEAYSAIFKEITGQDQL